MKITDLEPIEKARFYQLVRDFCINVKDDQESIKYNVSDDERSDLTLISYRVYGKRELWYVIAQALGINFNNSTIENTTITLPTPKHLNDFFKLAKIN